MHSLEALSFRINEVSKLKPRFQTLIEQVVLPEIQSTNPFLRIRACQIYQTVFQGIDENDQRNLPQIMKVVDGIFNCLQSQELPIKFFSALAFSKALEIEALKPFILPNLQKILGIYLQIMQDVEHESLIEALERIIVSFHEQIHPYAIELTQRIVDYYI
jgi:importin-7